MLPDVMPRRCCTIPMEQPWNDCNRMLMMINSWWPHRFKAQINDCSEQSKNHRHQEWNDSSMIHDCPPTMLMVSDTYEVLCDIHCHNWIVQLLSSSYIYPRLKLPTARHFELGSVHDVSNLVSRSERCSCLRQWCRQWWCSTGDGNQTETDDNYHHHHHHHRRDPRLSSVSVINSVSPIDRQPALTQPIVQQPPPPPQPPVPRVEIPTAPEADAPSPQIPPPPPPPSSSTEDDEWESSISSIPGYQLNLATLPPVAEPPEPSTSSTFSTTIRANQFWCCCVCRSSTWKRYLVLSLFFIISMRYLIHLAFVVFQRNRLIEYQHCPLIVATMESISCLVTMALIYMRRSAIEDLVIASASFYRPLNSFKRKYIVQLLAISYFLLNLLFLLINCFLWFPIITGIDSRWHHFRRTSIENLIIFHHYKKIINSSSKRLINPKRHIIETNLTESENIDFRYDEFDYFWEHQTNFTTLNFDDDNSVTENSVTMTTDHYNDDDDNRTKRFSQLPSTTPSPARTNRTKSMSKKAGAKLLEFFNLLLLFDFFTHLFSGYSLILLRTFHFSLTVLILIKCWQLHQEILRQRKRFAMLKHRQREELRRHKIDKKRNRKERSLSRQEQAEMERLSILTHVLRANIRSYESIYGNVLIIWLAVAITSAFAVLEFYSCIQQQQQNHSGKSGQNQKSITIEWFDRTFLYATVTMYTQDFVVTLACYAGIRYIRYRCRKLLELK